ncbi:MAG: T9SS type A sorting domain-containing protein [Bacteroidota bacterium]
MRRLLILSLINLFIVCVWAQDLPWPSESANPDGFGYTFKTNSAAGGPQYDWVEITNTGTVVEGLGDDNFVGPFQLGIDFKFYWLDKTEVWISSNGHISFAPNVISSNNQGFPPFPRSDGKNDIIAPYLTDLNAGENEGGNPNLGEVLYLSDPANNRFIVTYKNIPYWVRNSNGWEGANTFQVILDGNDNSITFQYKTLFGNWATNYDADPFPFTVGIEAITGTFGLSATQMVTASDRPVNETAIQFFPPANPGPVVDVAVNAAGPSGNQAFFVPWNPFPQEETPRFRLKGKVRNFGSAAINSAIIVQAQVTDSLELLYVNQVDTVFGGLQPNQEKEFTFSDEFYPAFASSYNYNISILNGTDFGDVNGTNDGLLTELVTVDTSKDEFLLTYLERDDIRFVAGATLTPGDDGYGVLFEPPAYPMEIREIQVGLGLASLDPLNPGEELGDLAIFSVSSDGSIPGQELYRFTVTEPDFVFGEDFFSHRLPTPISITEGGFYVAWFQKQEIVVLTYGNTPPISRRSFEVLSSVWSPDRNAGVREYALRAMVSLDDNAVYTPIDREIESLKSFDLYPNPNQGRFTLEVALDKPSELGIKVFDIAGNKVFMDFESISTTYQKDLDLSSLSPGLYVLQLSTAEGQESKRFVIR